MSTWTTFTCHRELVVKFNLVYWFRDWLTNPWWTEFCSCLGLRKGVKFGSLGFPLPFEVWLGFSPYKNDRFYAWIVFFYGKHNYNFSMNSSLQKLEQNCGKSFPSSICTDFGFRTQLMAKRYGNLATGWVIHWTLGGFVLPPWWGCLFCESHRALGWLIAVAGEKFAFLMGSEYGAQAAIGGSRQSTCS